MSEPDCPDVSIELSATTEQMAAEEGSQRWKEVLARGTFLVARERHDAQGLYVKQLTFPRNPRFKI